MVGIPAPLYRKLIEEGKGVWIEHPTFGKVFQPDLDHVPAELLRPAPVDQVKRIERKRAEEKMSEPEWMEKQLRSIQIDTKGSGQFKSLDQRTSYFHQIHVSNSYVL